MRFFVCILSLLPLVAQQPPAVSTAQAPPASPSSAPAASAPQTPPAAASPVPADDSWLTGSIDFGYRWQSGVGGSFDAYRSIVNLGSGPKLLGTEFTILDPRKRVFDQVHVRAYNWGDDPYATFHLDARKSKLYEFNADYRDIAYFNYLPSYADPLLSRGIVLNEQSFDTRRRLTSLQLELFPNHWITPYLAFDRDSGSGHGVTTLVSDGNEFPVPNILYDQTNWYRGGVRFELRRFHATLEQGGTTFKDNQTVYTTGDTINYGNVSTPILGQTLYLSHLLAAYGIGGDSIYTKALFTTNATNWLDVYGQFLYSQPNSNVAYQQYDTGNFFLLDQFLFYNGQQYLLTAAAKLPHTTVSLGAEIRPLQRVRIVESWLTDRLHTSGSAASTQVLSASEPSPQMTALLASSLVTNYSQQEIDVFFDATARLTLRGGYRYVWGDASDVILPLAGLVGMEQGRLRRNVGLGGVVFRPSQKLSVSGDAEIAVSTGAYFRTSLYNYRKFRARAHYQASASLSISADMSLLDNQNPASEIGYDYLAHQESIAVLWSPGTAKKWDFQGSYSRSTVRSDILYFSPQDLQPQPSFYRDNAHTVSALFDINLPHYSGLAPKISAGGSFFLSSGSRPTNYYQPLIRLLLPVTKNVSAFAEWRYYGYGEAFYLYEGFRTHLATAGLRVTR